MKSRNSSGPNLLIVDDNSTNLLFIVSLLRNIDVRIIRASSGHEALEKTKDTELALALLDVQMPLMDGYELAVRLNQEREEHIPIIFITATYPSNELILRGYEAGAVDFILKPFQSQILISKVNVFLELYRQKQKIREIAIQLSQTTESLSRANASLTVSEEEYRSLLNASPDGIVLTNTSGIITDISRSTLKMFGTEDRRDILGKHFIRFVFPGQSGKVRHIADFMKKKGLAHDFEFTLLRKDLSHFPSEISATRIERQYGAPLSFMFLIRDISHRKTMESQLLHSERLASLGEMATAMAHEINQPLNTLSLVFDNMILKSSQTGTLGKTYFQKKSEKIFESIQRIKNTIDHVRVFSRSNINSVPEPFSVNKSISNALSIMNEQIRQSDIMLTVSLHDSLPPVLGNTFEMEQVIINLISNARDALLDKQLNAVKDYRMCLTVRTLAGTGGIVVEVEDNGTGIKENLLDQVLLPFFSTKETGKGTGLGLALTYGIINKMNGEIKIQSKEFKGTKVVLELPAYHESSN